MRNVIENSVGATLYEHLFDQKYLGHFFILPYFPMAEPCCDTSSFSIDVVLASHQIKRSYALLLVYIYIHNVFS